MIPKEQELLAKVLDMFAQKFNKKAVLRGGMVLRILGSQRFTNDLDYILQMKAKPDLPTLAARLAKPSYSKLVGVKARFQGKTCEDFYSFICGAVNSLDDQQIRNELSDYLPVAEIEGLSLLFKSAFARLL